MNTECNGNCDQGRRCDCENLESVQSALKVAQDNPYWENEAKRYAGNAEYWRERAEKAEAKLAAIEGAVINIEDVKKARHFLDLLIELEGRK
jgi:hypothetical protein